MKKHICRAVLLALATIPLAGLAVDNVLYQEDFSSFPVDQRPAGFNAKCLVKEEDGARYLSYPLPAFGYIFQPNMTKYLGSQKWQDIELSFRFRFPDPKKNGFSLILKSQGDRPAGVKYLLYYVGIKSDGAEATAQGASKEDAEKYGIKKVAFAEKGLSPLEAGKWYKTKVVVKGASLELSLENGGTMVQLFSGEVMPGGGGIDFLTYTPLDLADIRVVEPSAVAQ